MVQAGFSATGRLEMAVPWSGMDSNQGVLAVRLLLYLRRHRAHHLTYQQNNAANHASHSMMA